MLTLWNVASRTLVSLHKPGSEAKVRNYDALHLVERRPAGGRKSFFVGGEECSAIYFCISCRITL